MVLLCNDVSHWLGASLESPRCKFPNKTEHKSYTSHGLWNHRKLDCLFNTLFSFTLQALCKRNPTAKGNHHFKGAQQKYLRILFSCSLLNKQCSSFLCRYATASLGARNIDTFTWEKILIHPQFYLTTSHVVPFDHNMLHAFPRLHVFPATFQCHAGRQSLAL